jgi:hypothetical protein
MVISVSIWTRTEGGQHAIPTQGSSEPTGSKASPAKAAGAKEMQVTKRTTKAKPKS